MKTRNVLLCLSAVFLVILGCATEDQPLQPGNVQKVDANGPGAVSPSGSGLVPGGYYSFAGNYDAGAYSDLELINTGTGNATIIWHMGLTPGEGVTPFGLAFDLDGSMYTTLNYVDFNPANCWSQLARLDPLTGAVTRIGGRFPMNTSGPEIDACGNLYVLGFDVPHLGYIHGDRYLYRMDKGTGVATPIGYTGDDHEWMDMAFDSHGQLWGTWGNRLYQINTQTGAATLVTPIFGVPGDPPPPPYTLKQEVMSIAFDANDVLYGTAMNVEWDTGHGSPVMRINSTTGQATLLGYTEQVYNHGGDIMPTKVKVCHVNGKGRYIPIHIGIESLPDHQAHGDLVPGLNGAGCNCPTSPAGGGVGD